MHVSPPSAFANSETLTLRTSKPRSANICAVRGNSSPTSRLLPTRRTFAAKGSSSSTGKTSQPKSRTSTMSGLASTMRLLRAVHAVFRCRQSNKSTGHTR